MPVCLVQQGACDMVYACAVQKRPEECFGFIWPVGPYIARERRVGQRIEPFRYCQACSGWVVGHGNARGTGYLRDLQGDLSPAFARPFVFAHETDRLAHLSVDNGKWYQEELLHPHASLDIIYQGGVSTASF